MPYWDTRSHGTFTHYGETFYTVTPIHYYLERRAWLLGKIEKNFGNFLPVKLLDFGCGDGFYSRWLARNISGVKVLGYDYSSGMIDLARQANFAENITYTSDLETVAAESFDAILCVAVLAHVPDSKLGNIISNWRKCTRVGSLALVFEQTATVPVAGTTWSRRTIENYRSLFFANGWVVTNVEAYERPTFDIIWRSVARLYGKLGGLLSRLGFELPKNMNSVAAPRMLLGMAERLTRPMDRGLHAPRGNTLFVLQRSAA